jgi:antitoxin HicB
MLRYPVELSLDTNGIILVEVPDIPEAHTFGDDEEEALMRALDAIESALSF